MSRTRNTLAFAFALLLLPSAAFASTLQDFMVERVGYNFGDPNSRSFDGPGHDYVSPFLSLSDGKFYQLMSVTGPLSDNWSLVAEVAGNKDGNSLGLEDQFGNYAAFILGSDSAPSSGNVDVTGAGPFTFAMFNPNNNFKFYSVDAMNSDQSAHFHAFNIVTAGNVVLPNLSSVALLPGDVVLAIEDLPAFSWDWDYNDMVVVMREVPEPATCLLLATGIGGILSRRKQRARVSASVA